MMGDAEQVQLILAAIETLRKDLNDRMDRMDEERKEQWSKINAVQDRVAEVWGIIERRKLVPIQQGENGENGGSRFGTIEFWKGHVRATGLPAIVIAIVAYLAWSSWSNTHKASDIAQKAAIEAVAKAKAEWLSTRK